MTEHYRSPRVPDDLDMMLVLADGLGGGNGSAAIEASERRGQQEFVNSDVIPAEVNVSDAELTALGFVLGDQVEGDRLFRYAKLPEGWKRQATDHAMGSYIVDELGRRRVSVFYKAAFYDRSASAIVYSVAGYVQACVWEGTDPVLDDHWATRDAVTAAAAGARDQYAKKAKEWRDGIASGRFEAERVEDLAARDEKHAADWEALRARVAGEAR